MGIDQFLEEQGVRATAVRILVWRTITNFDFVFSLSDIEGALPKADRSTLFRTLTLFVEKGLLHTVDDGSGLQKYCIHHTEHVHFTCAVCGKTVCLENQEIPAVPVPEGFVVKHVSYLVQGICANCSKKR